ncbi:hypothetical protein OS493_011289 [Desmophyllum pertusum]|uniref:Uncharacterized protein n=1 Tax=Desmophyllum pertusum TaxID=174260 RepID=A0A9X0CS53_9CNID|nr:hypothetical protein OS493_011289 [Desmophyllum pertusum]
MDKYLREETYTELLNMGKYDSIKYSKVEDLGGKEEMEIPSEPVKKSSAATKLGKWSSHR